jgi:hypothetical protein
LLSWTDDGPLIESEESVGGFFLSKPGGTFVVGGFGMVNLLHETFLFVHKNYTSGYS